MQRTVKATPERLFADAQAFMVNQGATIAERSENAITFVAKQGVGTGDYVMVGLLSLFDLAAAASSITTLAVTQDQRATLVAIPRGDESAVTISDNQFVVDNLLRFWFVANVLREPLPNPIQKIQASYHKVLIWNDRVEAYSRIMFWRLVDTIKMEDVEAVYLHRRKITVQATDGREISIKAMFKEDAEQAAELIKGRVDVYSMPSLAS